MGQYSRDLIQSVEDFLNMDRGRAYRSDVLVAAGYALILEGLGFDWKADPHMKDTPFRAAEAMYNEICAGVSADPPPMTTFPCEGDRGMVVSRNIPVRSLCAHHLLPFVGEATVGYIPNGSVLGLSKLSRAVDFVSRRPQVQEDLTVGIADFLAKVLAPGKEPYVNVAVVIKARHMCMELRGVEHASNVVTSCLRGEFEKPEVRAEFLSLESIR